MEVAAVLFQVNSVFLPFRTGGVARPWQDFPRTALAKWSATVAMFVTMTREDALPGPTMIKTMFFRANDLTE